MYVSTYIHTYIHIYTLLYVNKLLHRINNKTKLMNHSKYYNNNISLYSRKWISIEWTVLQFSMNQQISRLM